MNARNEVDRNAHALRRLAGALGLMCALLCVNGAAQADADAIRARLEPKFKTRFDEVRPLPVGNLWEFVVGTHVFYTDANASFLIDGTLVDIEHDRNLTFDTTQRLLRVDPAQLPLDDAVKIVRGNGTRRAYVFEDPNCPHCRKLESELLKVDDLTLYAFELPILGPDSVAASSTIWCASDRAAARAAAYADTGIAAAATAAQCDAPIERNRTLARILHVDVTPTIVFADGSRRTGELTRAQLELELNKHVAAAGAH